MPSRGHRRTSHAKFHTRPGLSTPPHRSQPPSLPPQKAIAEGYDRASGTILDANLTTLIAALFLFQFGTGPVKGFAVTLSIGILASLFTAIVVTRFIFDYVLTTRRIQKLSI